MNQSNYSKTPFKAYRHNFDQKIQHSFQTRRYNNHQQQFSPKITYDVYDKINSQEKKMIYKQMLDDQIYQKMKIKQLQRMKLEQQRRRIPIKHFQKPIQLPIKELQQKQRFFQLQKKQQHPNYNIVREDIKNRLNAVKIDKNLGFEERQGESKFINDFEYQKKKDIFFTEPKNDKKVQDCLDQCQRILKNIKSTKEDQVRIKSQVSSTSRKFVGIKKPYKPERFKTDIQERFQSQYPVEKLPPLKKFSFDIINPKKINKEVIKSIQIPSLKKQQPIQKKLDMEIQTIKEQIQRPIQVIQVPRKKQQLAVIKQNKQIQTNIQKNKQIEAKPKIQVIQPKIIQPKIIQNKTVQNEVIEPQMNQIQQYFEDKKKKSNLQQTKQRIKQLTSGTKIDNDKNMINHLIRAKARGYKLFQKVKKYKFGSDNPINK